MYYIYSFSHFIILLIYNYHILKQSQQICGVLLSCGHHTCEKVCHTGPCGNCPRSGKRMCPCKKTGEFLRLLLSYSPVMATLLDKN